MIGAAAPAGGVEASPDWTSAILDAITTPDHMRLVFQPIVDLVEGTVVGYEALTRFVGPPVAGPNVWFAAASSLGMGAALEAKAVEMALGMRADLPPTCFLSINVSPLLLVDPQVQAALDAAGSLDGVVVELTEDAEGADLETIGRIAAELRVKGAVLALDDAGAGYAGLQQMAAARPGLVKLDRTLVDRVDMDPTKQALADLMGRFASRIGARIVAEGIERIEELDAFIALGAPLGQGHLFARPAPGFAELDPALSQHIRRRAAEHGGARTLAAVIEPAPSTATATTDVADHTADAVVVTDPDGRPVSLLLVDFREGAVTERAHPLLADAAADVAETLLSAMDRPPATRHDPIVCTSASGRYVGIARVDRLSAHLARRHTHAGAVDTAEASESAI
jgi:EAL domain-containing protein (putative c-di-GMP-specific phosphodiesterase class I)